MYLEEKHGHLRKLKKAVVVIQNCHLYDYQSEVTPLQKHTLHYHHCRCQLGP